MTKVTSAYGRYSYIHDNHDGPFQVIDTHHIAVQRSGTKKFLAYIASLLLLANACNIIMFKENSYAVFLWSTLLGLLFAKSLHRTCVVKESVVVMPTFGVQLETHFGSGRIIHRFVPLGQILRPLLNECVTPVTCYWSLALLIRGESELMLVFQELKPPVKMLVPIWKALCAATDSNERPHANTEGGDH